MKKFSILQAPFSSFFSRDLYVDVGLEWKGSGLGYIFLLLAVCWIPVYPLLHSALENFAEKSAPGIIEQVPPIAVTNGQVSVDVPQPYYINVPETNQVLFIIDTTGEVNSLSDTSAFALLTRTSLIFRKSEMETTTVDLSGVRDFRMDRERAKGFVETLQKTVNYPFVLIVSFVYRVVQVLLYAIVGLAFSGLCRAGLKYLTVLRLTAVAVSPCILVNTLLSLAGIPLPAAPLLYFLAAMGYLFFAMNAVSKAQVKVIEAEFTENE